MINVVLRRMLLIVLVLVIASSAKALTLDALLDKVHDSYGTIRTLEALFEQRNYQSATGVTDWFHGKIYFKKPQNFRIQVSEPEDQIILVDSTQMWIYIPMLKQITVQPIPRDINSQTLLSMLMGEGDPRQDFSIEWDQSDGFDAKGRYRVVLKPRVSQQGVDRITLAVDSKTYYMVDFIINDRLGNWQNIELKDIRINQDLSPALFQMKIPEGTTVVKPQMAPGVRP